MKEQALMFAIFGVIEHITRAELTNIAKTLIVNYYSGSERPTARERARDAVFRYAQCKSLPALEDIRKKTRDQLDKLEHLVLRMEYEAMRIDGSLPSAGRPAAAPSAPPASESYSPPVPTSPPSGAGPFRAGSGPEEKREPSPPAVEIKRSASRKTPLVNGSFSGVRTKRTTAGAQKPGAAAGRSKRRAVPVRAKAKKSKSAARAPVKKNASRPSSKKTTARKKQGR